MGRDLRRCAYSFKTLSHPPRSKGYLLNGRQIAVLRAGRSSSLEIINCIPGCFLELQLHFRCLQPPSSEMSTTHLQALIPPWTVHVLSLTCKITCFRSLPTFSFTNLQWLPFFLLEKYRTSLSFVKTDLQIPFVLCICHFASEVWMSFSASSVYLLNYLELSPISLIYGAMNWK